MITDEWRAKLIFLPYVLSCRISGATAGECKETGVGLAIVRRGMQRKGVRDVWSRQHVRSTNDFFALSEIEERS